MGAVMSWFSETFQALSQQSEPSNVALIGLDAAGKTTMLYKLRLGERLETLPTIGFNVETVEYGSIKFTVWDLGGQEKIRQLWTHYFNGVDAVIFVVDSADRERAEEAQDELWRVLNDHELSDICLLVFANKQDISGAMSVAELTEKLKLQDLRNRPWYVQSCVATEGDGLYDGLDWLANTLQKRKGQVQ